MYKSGTGVKHSNSQAVHFYQRACAILPSGEQLPLAPSSPLLPQHGYAGTGMTPPPYPQDPDGLPCHALAMAPPSHQGRYDEQECTFRSSTQLPPLPLMLTREGAYLIYDVALAFEGTTDAQVQLAHCHMTGSGTLNSEPNFAEAVRLLQLASKRNDPVALANLAGMYARGLGLDQDKVEAVRLYKLAAQSGHPPSQFNFGMMNMKGQGMRKDLKEAVSCT